MYKSEMYYRSSPLAACLLATLLATCALCQAGSLGGESPYENHRHLQERSGGLGGVVGSALDLASTALNTGIQQTLQPPVGQNTQQQPGKVSTIDSILKIPSSHRHLLQQFGSQLQNYVSNTLQGAMGPQQPQAAPSSSGPLPSAAEPAPVPQPNAYTAASPTAASSTPATGHFSPKLSGEDPLTLHNGYRSAHQNTGPLTYDTQLEASAQNWANNLASQCSFYHSGPGENMASGFQSWSGVMWAFYKEYQSYNYAAPGYSPATGHFTQLIWKATQNVGCAMATSSCSMGNVYVCHYSRWAT